MKDLLAFILITILSFVACIYFPWWSIAIVSFIVTMFMQVKPAAGFLVSFFAVFLLWSMMSFVISFNNEHILAHRVSLLILKNDNPLLLILLTGLVGGLVAGVSGVSGSLFAASFKKEKA